MDAKKQSRVVVYGGSRNNGNTHQLAQMIAQTMDVPIYNLSDYQLGEFDYQYRNRDDDFFKLIEKFLEFDQIILATPVYWYSPSAKMKIFLDRLSDLLDIEKDMGRKLRGKSAAVISTGEVEEAPRCFEDIFRMTYEYLGMTYQGMIYVPCPNGFAESDHKLRIDTFIDSIE